MNRTGRRLLASAPLLCCALAVAQPPKLARVAFQIEPQSMEDALTEVARASGLQLLFQSDVTLDQWAPRVDGSLTPEAALSEILANSGLRYEFVNPKTVTIRTAAAAAAAPGPGVSGTMSAQYSTLEARPPLEEVVVTGTHIRGTSNVGSPLIEISRDDIERSGVATTAAIVQRLTQNFGGGANEGNFNAFDPAAGLNLAFGSGVNLRGLGNDSTLVLVDGRRVAPGGSGASFVDLSMIPLTAIERIEVLTDGASAIYGSDAVGGVVNLIMRKNYVGAETRGRFGSVTRGRSREVGVGQVFGTDWAFGNVLMAYEYYDRDALTSRDRRFASDSDLTSLGGENHGSETSNPGNITDFSDNYAIPQGQDGTALTPDDLLPGVVNLQNTRLGADLLPRQKRHSAFVTNTKEISDRVLLFADARYSRRTFENRSAAATSFLLVPDANPYFVDPFGGSTAVFVKYSFADDLGPQLSDGNVQSYGGTLGTDLVLTDRWRLKLTGAYSREKTRFALTNTLNFTALDAALSDPDPATAFNPFADGSNTNPQTLLGIRGRDDQFADSDLWMASAHADGDLFAAPGGSAKLAIGVEYRRESFDYQDLDFRSGTEPTLFAQLEGSRRVGAAFSELYIPLVGEKNARRGMHRLEVSLAGRFEDYDDFGSTADPRLGVSWSPVESLALRGSIGTSFKAPLLSQLQSSNTIYLDPLSDPAASSGFTNTIQLLGVRDDLKPEEGTTWTVGLAYRPSILPSFQLRMNYFDVEIEDRIKLPTDVIDAVLANPEIYAPIITRNPDAATVNAYYADPGFQSAPLPPEEVGAIIDLRLANVATSNLRGVDLELEYASEQPFGKLDFRLGGSYLLDYRQALIKTAPQIDLGGTIGNPPDLRARGSVSWSRGAYSVTGAVSFTDGYENTISAPVRAISSWTTTDLQVAYSAADDVRGGFFGNITAALNVENLFNSDPPFVDHPLGVGFDAINATPLGRYISLQITKPW